MTLRVSGKNMNIGDALRQHVTDRLNGTTAKYFDGAVTGHVTIAPEGSGFRSDCSLHLTTGTTLQSDGRAQDVYASFEQAAERLEKRLRRYKERLKGRHPNAGPSVDGGGGRDAKRYSGNGPTSASSSTGATWRSKRPSAKK